MKLITQETELALNHLLQNLFLGNAIIDNMYYNLKNMYYDNLADAIHKSVAHKLPDLADDVTDMMFKLGAKPIRLGLSDCVEEYNDALSIFKQLVEYFSKLREGIKSTIEVADYKDDTEVCIWLEEFLEEDILPLFKQSIEWLEVCEKVDINSFNIHIKDYTHYLD